ncbi:MAG: EamA family transporter [Planctomycetota bacterium]|nr:EamA family transporter [Planctomycetota bacterium]
MPDYPFHLLLPLLASFLFVCGLLCVKRASAKGTGPWTVTFTANMWVALLFSLMWPLGGTIPGLEAMWQPALVALLYLLGQIFTFAAVEHGDVSVATPVFGVKVIVVALGLWLFSGAELSLAVWIAVSLAGVGIILVQWTPVALHTGQDSPGTSEENSPSSKMLLSIVLALLAAVFFGTFDVVVQSCAPAWGPGRLLPISFWIAGVMSLGFLPWCQKSGWRRENARWALIVGALLVALQANCIVFTLANFGDAARVNVVYTMRGMWGVVLAWAVAKRWGGAEAELPPGILLLRFIGASLLTGAVILVAVVG